MARNDDPLKPIGEKLEKLHIRLTSWLKGVFVKIKPMAALLFKFMKNVRSAAKQLAAKVGKAAVDALLKSADWLAKMLPVMERMLVEAIKTVKKLLTLIKKGLVAPVVKTLKSMIARLAKRLREFVARIFEFVARLGPIKMAISIIDSMKMLLMMMLRWIRDVSGVSAAVKKIFNMVKKVSKEAKSTLKDITTLVKETNALKVPG